jgi:hypothetical protein
LRKERVEENKVIFDRSTCETKKRREGGEGRKMVKA